MTVQKPKHPAITIIKDEMEFLTPKSPTLTPPAPRRNTDFANTIPFSRTIDNFKRSDLELRPVKKTVSYDSDLQHAVNNKGRPSVASGHESPRRKRLGSLEFIFKKAKRALSKSSDSSLGPRKVKGIYNMSTTSTKTTEEVMYEIENVLKTMGIKYEKENYIFHCSVPSFKESSTHKKDRLKVVRFDLEVCFLPRLEMIGVRRKRIKGDTWEFKRICGQIFEATHL